jgi:hypothetical protein
VLGIENAIMHFQDHAVQKGAAHLFEMQRPGLATRPFPSYILLANVPLNFYLDSAADAVFAPLE